MLWPIVSETFFSAFTPLGYVFDKPEMITGKGIALLNFEWSDEFRAIYHTGSESPPEKFFARGSIGRWMRDGL
jgi:hypothetical protein